MKRTDVRIQQLKWRKGAETLNWNYFLSVIFEKFEMLMNLMFLRCPFPLTRLSKICALLQWYHHGKSFHPGKCSQLNSVLYFLELWHFFSQSKMNGCYTTECMEKQIVISYMCSTEQFSVILDNINRLLSYSLSRLQKEIAFGNNRFRHYYLEVHRFTSNYNTLWWVFHFQRTFNY